MSMELYESVMRRLAMYRDVELSEQQMENGWIKGARTALAEMSRKYGI